MQSPSNQQDCPIPCSHREVDTLEDSRGILAIPHSLKEGEEDILQHIRLLVVIHLFTPLNLVMEQHRELEDLAILLTLLKEVEEVTLHILHQGEAILSNPSQLADRTAQVLIQNYISQMNLNSDVEVDGLERYPKLRILSGTVTAEHLTASIRSAVEDKVRRGLREQVDMLSHMIPYLLTPSKLG